MRNKFAFIIPYIGKLPSWFQLWLNSCARNKNIDWLLFTDDKRQFIYPDNVKVSYCQFDDLRTLFQKNFDFQISLEKPYKFCDYRPAYGEIFAEYLEGYSFWGYCDLDLIWGDLGKRISIDDIEKFDRISHWGHCTFIKNNSETNKIYQIRIEGLSYYRDIYQRKANFGFDAENGFNSITCFSGLKEFVIPFFDVSPTLLSYKFSPTFVSRQFFAVSTKDNIIKVDASGTHLVGIKSDGTLHSQDFAYVHLQRRKMEVCVDEMSEEYLIVPNKFIPNRELTADVIKQIVPSDFVAQMKRQKLLWQSRYNVFKQQVIK